MYVCAVRIAACVCVLVIIGIVVLVPEIVRKGAVVLGLALDSVGVYLLLLSDWFGQKGFAKKWPRWMRDGGLFEIQGKYIKRPALWGALCLIFGFMLQLGAALNSLVLSLELKDIQWQSGREVMGISTLINSSLEFIKTATADTITAAGTVVAALFAAIAAIAANISAGAAKKTVQVGLLSQFMNEYDSHEMFNALRTLRYWQHEHGENFARIWKDRLENGDSNARRVDWARHVVVSHFFTALRLYESRAVPKRKRFLRRIGLVRGSELLFAVAEPLERVFSPRNYNEAGFRKIEKICGKRKNTLNDIPIIPPPDWC